jgi:hypothetical protein
MMKQYYYYDLPMIWCQVFGKRMAHHFDDETTTAAVLAESSAAMTL